MAVLVTAAACGRAGPTPAAGASRPAPASAGSAIAQSGAPTLIVLSASFASVLDMYQGSPPANAVGAIVFTGAGQGWAFGPALWQTRDGGASWQRMSVPGGPVQDLAVQDRLVVG